MKLGSFLAGVAVGGLCVGATAVLRPFQVQEVMATYVIDGRDQRRLAGIADHVFRGRVVAKQGQTMDDIPVTLWTVEVLGDYKGDLPATVTVGQMGGYEPVSNTLRLAEDDALLTIGQEYVLAVKRADGHYLIATPHGDVAVEPGTTVDAHWKRMVAEQIPFTVPGP
ncbi:hypothetical protein [Herbidospora yilanensis]|uniref:hypothetical protein n=1 Tax=Herbidospora yilanensis TaxID=354426 RepID=UPI0007825160|nr:hypothetical protein [Herbidospora yilanensis]